MAFGVCLGSRIAMDPMFPPAYELPFEKVKYLPSKIWENNKFELIFDEERDAPAPMPTPKKH